jgi:hypothetical protein
MTSIFFLFDAYNSTLTINPDGTAFFEGCMGNGIWVKTEAPKECVEYHLDMMSKWSTEYYEVLVF